MIESISAIKILSDQLTEELTSFIRKVPTTCGLMLISHDFELPLKHANIEQIAPNQLFELMKQEDTFLSYLPEKSSMPKNLTVSERFIELNRNNSGKNHKGYRILILPHDFELSLKEASYIVNTTPKMLELMLENSDIITADRTIQVQDLFNFYMKWSDQKKKSFEEIVEYAGRQFGED